MFSLLCNSISNLNLGKEPLIHEGRFSVRWNGRSEAHFQQLIQLHALHCLYTVYCFPCCFVLSCLLVKSRSHKFIIEGQRFTQSPASYVVSVVCKGGVFVPDNFRSAPSISHSSSVSSLGSVDRRRSIGSGWSKRPHWNWSSRGRSTVQK